MNNLLSFEKGQGIEYLNGIYSDDIFTESIIVIGSYIVKKIAL